MSLLPSEFVSGGTNKVVIDGDAGGITVESSASITLKSAQISIEADASMTIKAGGTLTLKGALVQIN